MHIGAVSFTMCWLVEIAQTMKGNQQKQYQTSYDRESRQAKKIRNAEPGQREVVRTEKRKSESTMESLTRGAGKVENKKVSRKREHVKNIM